VAVITRFDPAKNSMLMVSIAKAWKILNPLRSWNIEVFGDGPSRSEVEHAVKAAGLVNHFIFHGLVPDARKRLDDCDCLLSTSVREGLPLNLIEAAFAARPMVVSNVVGNSDVAHETHGLTYSLSEPVGAAAALESLASQPDYAANIGRMAREAAKSTYNCELMADRTLNVYAAVVKRQRIGKA
jgi:glycosyltransferase involved in cell wall biosynthesis